MDAELARDERVTELVEHDRREDQRDEQHAGSPPNATNTRPSRSRNVTLASTGNPRNVPRRQDFIMRTTCVRVRRSQTCSDGEAACTNWPIRRAISSRSSAAIQGMATRPEIGSLGVREPHVIASHRDGEARVDAELAQLLAVGHDDAAVAVDRECEARAVAKQPARVDHVTVAVVGEQDFIQAAAELDRTPDVAGELESAAARAATTYRGASSAARPSGSNSETGSTPNTRRLAEPVGRGQLEPEAEVFAGDVARDDQVGGHLERDATLLRIGECQCLALDVQRAAGDGELDVIGGERGAQLPFPRRRFEGLAAIVPAIGHRYQGSRRRGTRV